MIIDTKYGSGELIELILRPILRSIWWHRDCYETCSSGEAALGILIFVIVILLIVIGFITYRNKIKTRDLKVQKNEHRKMRRKRRKKRA